MRGTLDEPLCENGILQAKKTAEYFKAMNNISHIYSSPLSRAYNTAIETGKALDLRVNIDEGFNDLDFGLWQGMLRSDIKKKYAKHYEIYDKYPHEFFSTSGDSLWALQRRSFTRIIELCKGPCSNLIIVSHYVTLRVMLLAFLNLTPREYWSINLDNCSISEVFYINGKFIINKINQTFHLM